MIEKMFGKEKDLQLYQDTLIKKSKLLEFDRVFKPTINYTNQIYNNVIKNVLGQVLKGNDAVICLFGLRSSGKNNLLVGKNADGLITQTFEEMINLKHISKLAGHNKGYSTSITCSIMTLYNRNKYDLFTNKQITLINNQITEKEIENKRDLLQFLK